MVRAGGESPRQLVRVLPPSAINAPPEAGQRSFWAEPDGRELLIADLADRYVRSLAQETCSEHRKNVGRALKRLLADFGGALRVGDLNPASVVDWRASRLEEGRMSKRTVNTYVGAWRACLTWACGVQLVGRNPLEHVKPLRIRQVDKRKVRRSLSPVEAMRFWAAAKAADERRAVPQTPLWRFLCRVGSRWKETVLLTWAEVDFINGIARILPEREKAGRGRWAAIPRDVVDDLRHLRALREVRGLACERVFLSPKGRRYPPKCTHGLAAFKRALRAAGIPFVTDEGSLDLHALRGQAISDLIAADRPLAKICLSVGQSDPKVTLRNYARLHPGQVRDGLFPEVGKKIEAR